MRVKNLGGLLREENAGACLGGRDDFLNENAIEAGNQALRHLLLLLLFSAEKKKKKKEYCDVRV